jgi:Family of unknown function (DUF6069)
MTLLALGRVAGGTFVVTYVPQPVSTPVGTGQVALFTVASIAFGLAVATLVARRRPGRVRTMQIVGAAVAVLSLFQPLMVDTDITTRAVPPRAVGDPLSVRTHGVRRRCAAVPPVGIRLGRRLDRNASTCASSAYPR